MLKEVFAALFLMAKNLGTPQLPSMGKWINKLWYILTLEYCTEITRNELLTGHNTDEL